LEQRREGEKDSAQKKREGGRRNAWLLQYRREKGLPLLLGEEQTRRKRKKGRDRIPQPGKSAHPYRAILTKSAQHHRVCRLKSQGRDERTPVLLYPNVYRGGKESNQRSTTQRERGGKKKKASIPLEEEKGGKKRISSPYPPDAGGQTKLAELLRRGVRTRDYPLLDAIEDKKNLRAGLVL